MSTVYLSKQVPKLYKYSFYIEAIWRKLEEMANTNVSVAGMDFAELEVIIKEQKGKDGIVLLDACTVVTGLFPKHSAKGFFAQDFYKDFISSSARVVKDLESGRNSSKYAVGMLEENFNEAETISKHIAKPRFNSWLYQVNKVNPLLFVQGANKKLPEDVHECYLAYGKKPGKSSYVDRALLATAIQIAQHSTLDSAIVSHDPDIFNSMMTPLLKNYNVEVLSAEDLHRQMTFTQAPQPRQVAPAATNQIRKVDGMLLSERIYDGYASMREEYRPVWKAFYEATGSAMVLDRKAIRGLEARGFDLGKRLKYNALFANYGISFVSDEGPVNMSVTIERQPQKQRQASQDTADA